MRNDARPIGENSPASPVGGDASPREAERHDGRGDHRDDHRSPIVNRGEEGNSGRLESDER
jgi:hypothetical protein